MKSGQIKKCPLCANELICRPDDIAHCHCNKIILTPAAAQFLTNTGLDCLCNDCLEKVNKVTTPN